MGPVSSGPITTWASSSSTVGPLKYFTFVGQEPVAVLSFSAAALPRLGNDWETRFSIRPWMVETSWIPSATWGRATGARFFVPRSDGGIGQDPNRIRAPRQAQGDLSLRARSGHRPVASQLKERDVQTQKCTPKAIGIYRSFAEDPGTWAIYYSTVCVSGQKGTGADGKPS